MIRVRDARGVDVTLAEPPQRIVSLVPSSTASLFDLGVGDRVVGVTRFCIFPAEAKDRPKIGGTKDVDAERVRALQPDLIVANCEENTREIFDAVSPIAPLYAAFPRTIEAACDELTDLGTLAGVPDEAATWTHRIRQGAAGLQSAPSQRAAALIWRDPWMSVSADTFTHQVMTLMGLTNVFADRDVRFPVVTAADLAEAAPDVVLLLSEPFPFRSRHADELAEATGLSRDTFRWVQGEDFTWHGTHLARALPSLRAARDRGFDPLP